LKPGSRPFPAHSRTVRSETPHLTATVYTDRTRSPSAANGFMCPSPSRPAGVARSYRTAGRRGSPEEDVKARGSGAALTRPALGPDLKSGGRALRGLATGERVRWLVSIVEPRSDFRNRGCRKFSTRRAGGARGRAAGRDLAAGTARRTASGD